MAIKKKFSIDYWDGVYEGFEEYVKNLSDTNPAHINKGYVMNYMDYTVLDDGSTIEPSQITNIRCDGVVEYVYEYFGYKVGGGSTSWNISKNYLANYQDHYGTYITPQTQNQSLLYRVTTNQSDLY